MNLNTYESAAIPDVFITTSSVEAGSVIGLVDKLSALQLRLVRGDYSLRGDANDLHFLELVTAGIAESGYAVHGFDVAAERRRSVRRGAPAARPATPHPKM